MKEGGEKEGKLKDDIQTYGYMYVSTHLYLQLW